MAPWLHMDEILTFRQQKEVKRRLMALNLDCVKVNKHLMKNKRTGEVDPLRPRHGISWESVKPFVKQIDKIDGIKKRSGVGGTRYSISYKISGNKFIIVIFLLDEKPPMIFDIYPKSDSDTRRMNRRYKGYYGS